MRRAAILALLAAACGPRAVPAAQPTPLTPGQQALAAQGAPRAFLEPALEWAVYGDTPSVAWAPDNRRLAVANQVNYLGTPDLMRAGIEVVDVTSGVHDTVHTGIGFHPVWLGDRQLAFGCSPYECDEKQGLYLLTFGETPKLLVKRGVYHTRAAWRGRILFFSGWPEYESWMLYDVGGGSAKKLGTGDDSWRPPADELLDQCPSQVGSRRVLLEGDVVTLVDRTTGQKRGLLATPPWRLAWPEDKGDIQPCLSPDGRYVVYFTQKDGAGRVGVLAIE